MKLWKFSKREILARPGRAILTLLSIVIGVAAAVSVALATGTARIAHEQMFENISGHVALEVVALDGSRFDPSVAAALTDVPEVAAVVPSVRQGTIMYFQGKRLKTVAVGSEIDPQAPPSDMELTEGRFPEEPSEDESAEAAINVNLARGAGIKVGDQVSVLSPKGGGLLRVRTIKLEIVGLVRLPVSASFGTGGGLFLTLDGAEQLLYGKLLLDTISIEVEHGAALPKVMQAVNERLPEGLICRTPPGRAEASRESLMSVQQGLDFASTLSITMAAFIILNTFLMNLGERRRSLAIMRAIGATRLQVVRMMLREGLALGIVGTLLGVPLGIFGAQFLMRVMEGILQADLPHVQPTPKAVIMAVVLGPVVSVVAAVFPAHRAGKISPLEVMNPVSAGDTEKFPVRITMAALAIWTVCLVLTVVTLAGGLPPIVMIPSGILMMIAFVLLIPLILGPFAELIHWLGRPLMGMEGGLAMRQLLRKRIRTTLTISVLVVAIANGIGIGNTVITSVQDVRDWQRRTFLCDFLLRPAQSEGGTSLTDEQRKEILEQLREISGVNVLETARYLNGRAAGMPAAIVARDFDENMPLPFDEGAGDRDELREQLREGAAVVGTVLATRTGLKVGDEITIEAHARNARLPIAGLTNDYMTGGLAVYLQADVARKALGIEGADLFMIQVDPDERDSVEQALVVLSRDRNLLMQSFSDIRRRLDGILAGVVGCFWGLLALGFIVAAFGIVNTLTMNVLEQTRELGLLRAVGMTRGQIAKMMLCQAAMLGVMGAVLGAIAGVTTAYVIAVANEPLLGHRIDFKLDYRMLLLCFGGAFLLVTAAGYFPSRRAARLDLMEALAYE